MTIRLITKKQAKAEARDLEQRLDKAVERGKYLGRCLRALRSAREYVAASTMGNLRTQRLVLEEIDEVLLNR